MNFFQMLNEEKDELEEEVNDLYNNVDWVVLSVPEGLEIMGFKEHFDEIANE